MAVTIASIHFAYPRRDGQAELAWVAWLNTKTLFQRTVTHLSISLWHRVVSLMPQRCNHFIRALPFCAHSEPPRCRQHVRILPSTVSSYYWPPTTCPHNDFLPANQNNIFLKLEILGRAQREATRRRKSDFGGWNSAGSNVTCPRTQLHYPRHHVQCWSCVGQHAHL